MKPIPEFEHPCAETGAAVSGWRPRFGDVVENGWASEGNPTRRGYFVRSFTRKGRLNPGLTWEITDGEGKFWELQPRVIGDRLALSPPPPSSHDEAGRNTEAGGAGEADELYALGERDGYDNAVQDIDLLTGGDGEYRLCTDGDPNRHTPDAATMKARIVARFEELRALAIKATGGAA